MSPQGADNAQTSLPRKPKRLVKDERNPLFSLGLVEN